MEMNFHMQDIEEDGKPGIYTIPIDDAFESSLVAKGQTGTIHFEDNRSEPVKILGLEKKGGRTEIRCCSIKKKTEAL
jgi:hypothetical protein